MSQIDANAGPLVAEADWGAVRRLTLVQGARRNPLSRAMIDALSAAIARAVADQAVRVLVLAAEGPAFCAGHDLAEMRRHRMDADGGAAFFGDLFAACGRLMADIVACPKPVIAEVRGMATAAGCQLVASCDLAYAAPDARFATPGVAIGLFCATPMVALSRSLPRKHAMEMLLTAEAISAETAARLGLINRVVAAEALTATVQDLAEGIAARSAIALGLGKDLFQRQLDQDLAGAYALAAETMTRNMLTEDAAEGIAAFLERRPPVWRDR